MKIINDPEFGEIIVRTHHNTNRISLGLATDGRVKISTPKNTPLFSIKLLIKSSRSNIRKLLSEHRSKSIYDSNRQIGKSHNLIINLNAPSSNVSLMRTKILVSLASGQLINDVHFQQQIRQVVIKALKKEAKSYLPRRLSYLAKEHGMVYAKIKLTHSGSRWGSCSSLGTISLNIALMQLPFEIIDYVIYHELSHTKHMNHSTSFWELVCSMDPDFKKNRLTLKQYSPII